MARYTYDYACGHGEGSVQLYGPGKERERKLDWYARNHVCPDCYKKQRREADAKSEQRATLCYDTTRGLLGFCVVVEGQLEANKPALYAAGYHWEDDLRGLLGYLSPSQPSKALKKGFAIANIEELKAKVDQLAAEIEPLGYTIKIDSFSPLDLVMIREQLAEKAAEAAAASAKEEWEKTNPPPPISTLRQRIQKLEVDTGSRWNGKIYGRPGSYNFYVANEKHSASNEEVAEREENLKLHRAWQAARDAFHSKK